ncbi:MAG: hypothetical protein UY41_C0012G0020 [Candidatus Moranbacteria bacterium GW2011_GWE1_49_15]|nr:MAG: hypothetical protein UX75_C0013G0015 [Candidatus Moranbacteria bacterium GW2011_GWE2_47_10]KKW06930.1 MAG: hypothetical protein UY41_C0012G0020 [Candidatus Moranbacteria bacterium GW2011_GWE1_49_15]HBP01221.1 hypothetical protein [Candidatus Moranbacteria bacterium]
MPAESKYKISGKCSNSEKMVISRRMEKKTTIRHRFINPVLMWFLVAIGVFLAFLYVPAMDVFERTFLGSLVFVLTICYWAYFFIGSIIVNRKAALSVDSIDRLVTEGVYGMVRHPIYSADIFLSWGFLLVFPDLKVLVSVIWLTLVLAYWMVLEENALEEKFGREYREYEKNVPMVIPEFKKIKK